MDCPVFRASTAWSCQLRKKSTASQSGPASRPLLLLRHPSFCFRASVFRRGDARAALQVLAAAAGPANAVVTLLSQFGQARGWQIAHQTRQDDGEGGHEGPARAAVGLGARAGLVGARALVVLVLCAVVEDSFDQAHAGGCIHQALSRAQALLVADPARRKGPGERTLRASALSAALAEKEVLLLGRGGRDQRQPTLTSGGARASCWNLSGLQIEQFRGG